MKTVRRDKSIVKKLRTEDGIKISKKVDFVLGVHQDGDSLSLNILISEEGNEEKDFFVKLHQRFGVDNVPHGLIDAKSLLIDIGNELDLTAFAQSAIENLIALHAQIMLQIDENETQKVHLIFEVTTENRKWFLDDVVISMDDLKPFLI